MGRNSLCAGREGEGPSSQSWWEVLCGAGKPEAARSPSSTSGQEGPGTTQSRSGAGVCGRVLAKSTSPSIEAPHSKPSAVGSGVGAGHRADISVLTFYHLRFIPLCSVTSWPLGTPVT